MVVDMAHSMADPELNRILKEQAWTGARFRSSTLQNEFDVNSCLHALSNYYLKISNAAMLRSKIVRQASVASVSSAFNAAANDARILDQIRPYLPDLLVQYLKSNPIRKKEKDPRVISFASACMLADISGFSKFSGAMCSKGVSGLDELRETTSVFLGEFVKCVYEYGGDGKY